jgi:hypothetical protein
MSSSYPQSESISDNVNDINGRKTGFWFHNRSRHQIHAVTGFIDTLGSSASVKALSLKAGITTR